MNFTQPCLYEPCNAFEINFQIVARECDILGVETNSDALERSGLMAKVPQVEREAILMYEYIKDKTKQDGHTCVKFDAIMNYFGSILSMIEEAHEFLEDNKVMKLGIFCHPKWPNFGPIPN